MHNTQTHSHTQYRIAYTDRHNETVLGCLLGCSTE
jgi:hypothetical protein